MLLLHPNASSWLTSLNFTTKSTSGTQKHYALYEDCALEFLAPYEHDADQKFTMVEEEAWKVLSDDERLLLREVKQRFPRIALWHFYFASPEAEHALKCMNSLTSMERLPSVALVISTPQDAPIDTQFSMPLDADNTTLGTSLFSAASATKTVKTPKPSPNGLSWPSIVLPEAQERIIDDKEMAICMGAGS
ncbi:hypothetical protein H0H92_011401 [Tricholoma furcatifolium]|nr:hypothetical protein H0H92_011401 [Tricholoma furcatifolium]